MRNRAGIAQALRKMIPGSFSGQYKGAQPVVQMMFDRGPPANASSPPG